MKGSNTGVEGAGATPLRLGQDVHVFCSSVLVSPPETCNDFKK